MTYLQLVNQVLRRLREGEVATVSQSSYSKLIGDYINETKREVEEAWNWVLLRSTIQVNTVASTFRYTLTGAGNRFRILSAFNDTDDFQMKLAPRDWMTKQFNGGQTQNASPLYYDMNGSSGGDPNVDVWPIPDSVYDLNFDMVLPQDDLSADDDTLTVPHWPVVLGAYAKGLSERGEDGGFMFAEALTNYQKALGDAVSLDMNNVHPVEHDWNVQ